MLHFWRCFCAQQASCGIKHIVSAHGWHPNLCCYFYCLLNQQVMKQEQRPRGFVHLPWQHPLFTQHWFVFDTFFHDNFVDVWNIFLCWHWGHFNTRSTFVLHSVTCGKSASQFYSKKAEIWHIEPLSKPVVHCGRGRGHKLTAHFRHTVHVYVCVCVDTGGYWQHLHAVHRFVY